MILEGSNYTLSLRGEEIEVRYRDTDYNQHFIIIHNEDTFVMNYLNNDINALWEFIESNHLNNTIKFQLDEFGNYIFIIKKPIYLKYHLKPIQKDKADLRMNTLVQENKLLKKELYEVKKKLNEFKREFKLFQRTEYINHFDKVIHLNSYEFDKISLMVELSKFNERTNNYDIYTTNFSSLTLFHQLTDLVIRNDSGRDRLNIQEFDDGENIWWQLSSLKLKNLTIENTKHIYYVDFLREMETLQSITLTNLSELEDITELFSLSNLTNITIHNCPKLNNISSSLFKNPLQIHFIQT